MDMNKQNSRYDIDNIVSLSFYPGSGRRQANNIDITQWTNKANIVVPTSSKNQESHNEELLKVSEFCDEESEGEELTDDSSYLKRHERASIYMMES